MKSRFRSILAATAFAVLAPAFAPALADEPGPWMVRARVLGVLPDESGALSAGGAALPGDVDIGDQYVPELDISYFLTDQLALELILGVTPHDVSATGVTVGPLNRATIDLGDVWLLPPTLTLQYHFMPEARFQPYVGAGVNATLFFNEDEGPVADSIDYDPSFGPALQAGFDYDLDGEPGGWRVNVDVKKIWINSEVTVDFTSALGAALGASSVIVNADVDIDPWVVGAGMGYRF